MADIDARTEGSVPTGTMIQALIALGWIHEWWPGPQAQPDEIRSGPVLSAARTPVRGGNIVLSCGQLGAQGSEAEPTSSGRTTGLIQRRRLWLNSPIWREAVRIAARVSRLQ